MNAVATIALVSGALALYAAVLVARISGAPGSRDERWFALAAAAAGVHALSSPVVLLADDPRTVLLFSRLQFAAVAVHFAAWVRYAEAFLALRRARGPRLSAAALAAAAAAALVPGVALRSEYVTHAFPAWGVVYREALHTPFGNGVLALVVLASLFVLGHLARAARRRVPHAAMLAVAYAALLALWVNDALAASGRIATPLLLDVGFAVPVLAVAWMMAGRFVAAARAVDALQRQLLADVETRTRELAHALDALHRAEKLVGLGEFASGIAHEVNSPASVVTANLNYLWEAAQTGSLPPDGGEALADALASMRRINDLVRRLVDAGRIAASPSPGSATVRVADAVAAAAPLARARAGPRVTIVESVPPELAVRARRETLEEVLGALLANAVDAIPEDRAGRIEIAAARAAGAVRVTVRDDGVGMTPEVLRRALDPFFTTKPPGRGAGLGLAVARALAEAQGGSLSLESAPGAGTAAHVELPEAEGEPRGRAR